MSFKKYDKSNKSVFVIHFTSWGNVSMAKLICNMH